MEHKDRVSAKWGSSADVWQRVCSWHSRLLVASKCCNVRIHWLHTHRVHQSRVKILLNASVMNIYRLIFLIIIPDIIQCQNDLQNMNVVLGIISYV